MKNLCKHFFGVKSKNTHLVGTLRAALKTTSLACILATTALTACTDETDSLAFTNSLELSFGVNQADTRAIFNEATLPDASPVGVKLDGYNYTGLTYTGTTASGKQTWTPNQDVVLTETSGILYAYWPYSESIDMTAIPVDMIIADQIDWLYATPVEGINEDNASANVVMNHAAANINITINKGAYKGTGAIENITIQSDAFATSGTFNAAQETPSFIAYEGEGEPLSRTVDITTGTATDIMVVPNGTSGAISFTATVDGIQFTATSAAVTLESGYTYQYTLNLSDINTYMSVEGFSVTPWSFLVKDNLTMDLYDPLAKYADWVKLTYNVMDNSSTTQIFSSSNSFDIASVAEMAVLENDGSRAVAEPIVVTPSLTYQFSTTGTHTVYVKFADMTEIPDFAFAGCTGITEVTIGSAVTTIGEYAFYNCEGLTSITIPNSVETIGEMAFAYCTGLTEITIPNSVQTIGENAFYVCSGLTEVTIGSGVQTIGKSAFAQCTGLTSVTIGEGVKTIGQQAFYGCEGLTELVIPESVTMIGNYVFQRCKGLVNIKVDESNTVYDSRNNCNAIMETATNTLIQGCKNTVIPVDCQAIGCRAFEVCTGLTGVTIPNSVQTIGQEAFNGCIGMEEITIPNSVQTIGNAAFAGCSGLTTITSLATTAPSIGSYTFRNVKSGGTLYVSKGATGYDEWLKVGNTSNFEYYLGNYNWTMQEITGE